MRLLALSVLVLSFVAVSMPAAAQSVPSWASPIGGADSAPDPTPPMMAPPNAPGTPTQVPVDGGLGLLALAGAGYAARRLRKS